MPPSPAELFHGWHDFFILLGTASATLVGLMFIAVSIGANIFKEENRPALEVFLGPTVVHFAAVLVFCLLAIVPLHGWLSLAALAALIGLGDFFYAARIWFRLARSRYEIDLVDRTFYAPLPALAYLIVLVAAALLYAQTEWGVVVAAAGLLTLIVAAIRNAWDMMIWIAIKTPIADEKPTLGKAPKQ